MPYAFLPENVVAAVPTLSSAAVRVVIAVASFMNGEQTECFPKIGTIAKRAGLRKRDSVHKALRELSNQGVLRHQRRAGKSSVYRWSNDLSRKKGYPTKRDTPRKGTEGVPRKGTHKDTKKDTNSSSAPPARKPSPKRANHRANVWGWWIDANRATGRADPAPLGPDIGAGKSLSKLIADEELTEADLRACMAAFLSDTDGFLAKQGHPLRLLPRRLNAYRNAKTAENEEDELAHWWEENNMEDQLARQGHIEEYKPTCKT